jgi:diguanylate cyclase (GGDEF)-like protein
MLIDFIRAFPRLLDQLQRLTEVRRIPGVLVNAMIHSFGAEQAVVLVRRRGPAEDDPSQDRLVVAALATSERGLKVGSEVPIGEGQLGIAADVQRVLDRGDYLPETGIGVPGVSFNREVIFDVVAPMVVAEQTVGVIGFSRPARVHPQQKEMLQVIARLGAVTWRNLSTFRTVKHAAEVDELTGVFNKAAVKLKLSEAVFEARERSGTVSVFLLDIDNFKSYNDRNGHLAGDKLLRELAALVRETVRCDDVFGRFGGEEFLLILPGTAGVDALRAAEKVRQAIAEQPFDHAASQPLGLLSVSGGVANFPDDAGDAVDLLKAADAALYRAKEAGRNRVLRAETGINP